MKATIKNPAHLREILKIIKELSTEVRLVFSKECMRINTLDAAQAAMVLYEHRSCEADQEFFADIFLDHLVQALKNAGKEQDVTISVSPDQLLTIEYHKPRLTKYTLPLLDDLRYDGRDPKLPDMRAVTMLGSKQLKEALAAAEDISAEVLLSSRDGVLVLKAKADAGPRSCEIAIDAKEHNAKQDCASLFSITYLLTFADAAKLYEDTVLQIGEDYPMEMTLSDKDSSLRFVLANMKRTV